MIERTTVNGRPALVAYIGGAGEGTVEPDAAVLIKVRFIDDVGGMVFLDPTPTAPPTPAARARAEAEQTLARLARAERARETLARLQRREFDESKHPRAEDGKWTDGGGGSAKPKGKGKVKKEDFEKAKINLRVGDEALFLERWNEKVGIEPEEFKKEFLGGVDSTMSIATESAGKFEISGDVFDHDRPVGNFRREIDFDNKSAYSAYFKIEKEGQKHDIGKKVLGGNVAMYEKLGIDTVAVHANIDVGGYAWAKYGYVPTPASWFALRTELLRKVGGQSGGRTLGADTVEADEWGMLSTDQQGAVEARWMDETFSSFLESEEDNWRSSGEPLENAKRDLARESVSPIMQSWFSEAMVDVRAARAEDGQPPIPFTDEQIHFALKVAEYESRYNDGGDDPTFSWDDGELREPEGGPDPAQQTLPGIEPPDPSARLTEEMRQDIESEMTDKFNAEAEKNAERMDPPDYLRESIAEYQTEYWSSMEDSDRLRRAVEYGMADVSVPPEDDEEEPPQPTADPLLTALHDSNPKAIWKVADDPRGKKLLLGTGWIGKLELKDKDSMARFKAYVGKATKPVPAQAYAAA